MAYVLCGLGIVSYLVGFSALLVSNSNALLEIEAMLALVIGTLFFGFSAVVSTLLRFKRKPG